jgi:hypothetical protein
MIQSLMLLGIGFLAACLLMVLLAPLIHERAVRLTMRRCLAATPLSVAELQADKDQLRAQFAMSLRRLEVIAEETRAKAAAQLAEVGRKDMEIDRLKAELRKASVEILRLQGRELARKSSMRRLAALLVYLFRRGARAKDPTAAIPRFAAKAYPQTAA